MVDKVTTTSNYFPNVDITHKPKRLQRDNLAALSTSPEKEEESESTVPKVLTLERAIVYFESQEKGETKALFKQTAVWLRELLNKGKAPEPPKPEED